MAPLHRRLRVVPVIGIYLATILLTPLSAGAVAGPASLVVPGVQHQEVARLADLTTAGTVGTRYTDPADWAGLNASGTHNPSGVPGIQIDGYFPDTSTFNTDHGWNHDSQFVIRLPEHWNGGLVVTGAPGVRKQYSLDFTISDSVLAQGFAFAATDKGNDGADFYRDGARPGDAIAEWNTRVTELTVAAKAVAAQRYQRPVRHAYMTGISNGGYLTRWQLENHPELFDGGVDWEGALWRQEGSNLLTSLPTALREYPAYAATGDTAAHQAMVQAGFAAGSEPLWDYHYRVYWGLTQRIYREEFDPDYTGSDSDYDYTIRPAAVHDAVSRVSLTGRIRKPLITLHGTLDALLPIGDDSDVYAGLVHDQGRDRNFRYYRLEGGNHVDGLYDQHPDLLRPILPCYRAAFTALRQWVEHDRRPPTSTTVPRPTTGDLANSCALQD